MFGTVLTAFWEGAEAVVGDAVAVVLAVDVLGFIIKLFDDIFTKKLAALFELVFEGYPTDPD